MDFASKKANALANWSLWPVLISMSRDYPDVVKLDELLTPAGQAIARDMDQRCIYTESVSGVFRPLDAYLEDPNALDRPEIQSIMRDLSIGTDPNRIPDIPIMQWHSTTDQFLPLSAVIPMMKTYCAAGVDMRFFTVPLSEHIGADAVGWPVATAWLSLLLRGGDPGPRICPDL